MYVYIKSEPGVYSVGFYKPNGIWQTESDWHSAEEAAARVHYLNGGNILPSPIAIYDKEP